MLYIKPKCKSFSEAEVVDVVGSVQTAYLHVFFEQVAKLDTKPTQAVVQMVEANQTETIFNTQDLA